MSSGQLKGAYVGEDVPIGILYEDPDTGSAVEPDAAPTITITDEAGTDVVSAVAMTSNGTGDYEHVWDTTGESEQTYEITITAEFNSETAIERATIPLQD